MGHDPGRLVGKPTRPTSIENNYFCLFLLQGGGGGAAPAPGVEIPSGAFVAKITNDAREEEMEENMEQVSEV